MRWPCRNCSSADAVYQTEGGTETRAFPKGDHGKSARVEIGSVDTRGSDNTST